MTRLQNARYEMLLRCCEFRKGRDHEFPPLSVGAERFAQLDEIYARISRELIAVSTGATAGRTRKVAARRHLLEVMRPLATTSRGLIHLTADAKSKLRMPRGTSDVAMVNAAKAFIRDGEPFTDHFARLGLPASCIDDLRAALHAFEEASRARRDHRASRTVAEQTITQLLAEASEALRLLDIVVANTMDSSLRAGWRTARRVVDGWATRKRNQRRRERAAKAALAVSKAGSTDGNMKDAKA